MKKFNQLLRRLLRRLKVQKHLNCSGQDGKPLPSFAVLALLSVSCSLLTGAGSFSTLLITTFQHISSLQSDSANVSQLVGCSKEKALLADRQSTELLYEAWL